MGVRSCRLVVVLGAAVVALQCLPVSVLASPSVRVSWRPGSEVAVALDGAGRVYTAATVAGPRRSRVVVGSYTRDGDLRWERVWRPADATVRAHDLAIGPGGLVVVSGAISRFDPPFPCDDIWSWGWAVRAWSADGTARWQRMQAGWRACEVFGTSGRTVAAARDTVAVGVWHGDEYSSGARILDFDVNGRLRWQRELTFPGSEHQSLGDVAVGRGDAVYVAATRNRGALDEPERDQDAVLLKLRPDGATAWIRAAPDRVAGLPEDHDVGSGVTATPDGVVFVAVLFEPRSEPGARIARYTAGGELRWERSVSGVYLEASRWSWFDAYAGVWTGGSILAGNERESDGHGSHVTLRGFDGAGMQRWRVRLGADTGKLWGVYSLDAEGRTIAVSGYPVGDPSSARVWVLRG